MEKLEDQKVKVKVSHICLVCHSRLLCPECGGRLVKYGINRSTSRQSYLCPSCGRYTIAPKCSCPPSIPVPLRHLSESGRRCLTCGSGLNYCPSCGREDLVFYGTRKWTLVDGTEHSRQMYKCRYCHKVTINPACLCDLPFLSPIARRERERRIKMNAHLEKHRKEIGDDD